MLLFFKLLKESVFFALNNLIMNKLRTFLSLLGITIGIFAIIAVFTGIDFLEKSVKDSINQLGSNVIYIQKWPWTNFGPNYPWWKYFNRPVPQFKEVALIKDRCQIAEAVAFQVSSRRTIKYRNNSFENAGVIAVSHDMNKIHSYEFSDGRYFTDVESAAGRNLAILGSDIAEALYQGKGAIGKNVKILGRNLKIIGIFKKEGKDLFGTGMDENVLLPLNYARRITDIKSDRVNPMIMVKAREGVPNSELISELEGVMRSVRSIRPQDEKDFALNESDLITKSFEGFFDVISIVGFAIGFFSILVGGIGIANIMFVSVKERTPIIGIQKAVGAKSYFILTQFLCESITLCLIGGAIGLFLVWILVLIVNSAFDMTLVLTSYNMLVGVSASAIIGVIFGFIPAYTASQLDPVEAIRA